MNFSNEISRMNNMTYLAEPLGLVEHFKGSLPSNITVQRNLQPIRKSAADLGTMEVLNALWRRLDLWKKLLHVMNGHRDTYLDWQSPHCSNHIQGTTQHAISFKGGIVFPNCRSIFNSRNLGDMPHHVDTSEIDDMSQAADTNTIRERKKLQRITYGNCNLSLFHSARPRRTCISCRLYCCYWCCPTLLCRAGIVTSQSRYMMIKFINTPSTGSYP